MDQPSARATALAVGAVAPGSCLCLVLFFVLDGPFGTINDVGNAVLGVLCALLALQLGEYSGVGTRVSALVGGAVTVLGSYLVMSDTTGYYLAGLVSAFGFGLVGVWVIGVSRSRRVTARSLARVAGGVMALGLVNIVGIVQGMDDQGTAPTVLLVAGVSWAGTYLLLPIWMFRLARAGQART